MPVFVACQADSNNRNILIVGDSLSAGYGIAENESWTGGGLRRLPRALQVHKPYIVLIELGGNDGLRGTPVNVIRENLETMIKLSQKTGAKVILAGMIMPPNYGQAYTDAFAGIYSDLAAEYDAALIEFFMKNVALNPALMQQDQIHPNAGGQPYLLDNVWAELEQML